jgi:hypothetical protein
MEEIYKNDEAFNKGQIFESYIKGSKIQEVTIESIPKEVLVFFEQRSALYVNIDVYKEKNFENFYEIIHNNADRSYVAVQTKEYPDGTVEKDTYFFDTRNNEELGYGEVRFNQRSENDYFKNKPFVGITRTLEKFQRQGLGKRRVLEMGAYTEMQYQLPLNSDSLLSAESKEVWENLINEDMAEKYIEAQGGSERYRLLLKRK